MSTTTAIIFIVGKAMIWLIIPLLFGLYEMRRHRQMMKDEADGRVTRSDEDIPGWLQASRPPVSPSVIPVPEAVPAPEVERPDIRRAA